MLSLASATFVDLGTRDTHTATVSWGDGTPVEAGLVTESPFGPPGATTGMTGTVSAAHVYGDNGAFTVEVCVTDDDGATGCDSLVATVNNVHPSAEIDKSGAVLVNGAPTLIRRIATNLQFSGRARDPGSDDITVSWDWDLEDDHFPDHTQTYLVNPPDPDPLPSPSLQPRDVTDTRVTAYSFVCQFEVTFRVVDDDGGQGPDTLSVVIVGNAGQARSADYWRTQYAEQGAFDHRTLGLYLRVPGYMSQVFDEARSAATVENAYAILAVNDSTASARDRLDRQLLAAWLNFANGAIGYDQLVDTDDDGQADTSFGEVMAQAEAARLDPAATDTEIDALIARLQRLNR
jgi:hypothetical protein